MQLIKEIIEESDIAIEVVDARFVFESRIKEIEEYIRKRRKNLIIVINKIDLIDKKCLEKIKRAFIKEFIDFCFVSTKSRKGIASLRKKIKKMAKKIKSKKKKKCCLFGLPNTGKSSLINMLRGRYVSRTSIQPGFTKGKQYVKLSKEILLIDVPGVYLPKLKEHELVFLNAIDLDKVKDLQRAAFFIFEKFKEAKVNLRQIYGIKSKEDFFVDLGKKNNFYTKGGNIDLERTYRFFLRGWYEGKIKHCFIKGFLNKKQNSKKIKNANKRKLIFDTNFLIYAIKNNKLWRIDELVKEYECFIIKGSIKEIKKLIRGKYKLRVELLLKELRRMINEKKIRLVEGQDVDKTIIDIVNSHSTDFVATYDKELIKKIKQKNVGVLHL